MINKLLKKIHPDIRFITGFGFGMLIFAISCVLFFAIFVYGFYFISWTLGHPMEIHQ